MILLLDLPEPTHGMSNVNMLIVESIKKSDCNYQIINTVPSKLARYYNTNIWWMLKLVHSLACFIRLILNLLFKRIDLVYRPLNGGLGQAYDLIYVLICKAFNTKLYFHHHSFNYLYKRSLLFSCLNKLAGSSTVHVVLGQDMASKLEDLYGVTNSNMRIVSNLAFFKKEGPSGISGKKKTLTLGYLANLSLEKGVDSFINICCILKNKNVAFEAYIAGPIMDEITKEIMENAYIKLPELKYLGPLYGESKKRFYENIDCFIFPSRYKNEAEPLVLYEAAIFGSYLIGTRRGCMQNVIQSLNGFSVHEDGDYLEEIVNMISLQIKNKNFDIQSREARLKLFEKAHSRSYLSLMSLIKELSTV